MDLNHTTGETAVLAGTSWLLSELAGERPLEDTEVTLEFGADGRAFGSGGCNRYGGAYSTGGGGTIHFGEIASTMMACFEPVMEQESRYLRALSAASAYQRQGQALALLDASGETLAAFGAVSQALEGTAWEVTAYNNGKGGVVSLVIGTRLTAAFDADGRVAGSAGCNRYHGLYTAGEGTLAIAPLASTRRLCPGEGVMEQEAAFLAALPTAAAYHISGSRLELRREDGALVATMHRAADEADD